MVIYSFPSILCLYNFQGTGYKNKDATRRFYDYNYNIVLFERWDYSFPQTSNFRNEHSVRLGDWGGFEPESLEPYTATICLKVSAVQDNADKLLERLWDIEKVPGEESTFSAEELEAVSHFHANYQREPNGRYVVGLHRRNHLLELGKSQGTALKRYLANERSLKDPICKWEAFHRGVQEYLDLQHAEKVPASAMNKSASESFYLPMHGVAKETSSTTKLRIVFDGSSASSTKYSLNDVLLPGPSNHPLLPTILHRFRMFPVALTGEVGKMFREVGLREEDRDLHRFLHRGGSGEIKDFRMARVTFGITTSPYLASQVLPQIAEDHKSDHPLAAAVIKTSFYVDDVLTGADSIEEAAKLR